MIFPFSVITGFRRRLKEKKILIITRKTHNDSIDLWRVKMIGGPEAEQFSSKNVPARCRKEAGGTVTRGARRKKKN